MKNRRVLLVDDLPAIHADFRKILSGAQTNADLDAAEAVLFGTPTRSAGAQFELDSAYQGQEAVALVGAARAAGAPYAMAFIDMRMPPGWDGVETIKHLWQADPDVQIVICTAFSDYSWEAMLGQLEGRDRLLILKKPFDPIEVFQLANTLTVKWDLTLDAKSKMDGLEDLVLQRSQEVLRSNVALQAEIADRKHLESQLIQSEKLASIGQLAAGIAHEINNPIGFVASNFNTLSAYLGNLFRLIDAYETALGSIESPDTLRHLEALRDRMELAFLKTDVPLLMQESSDGLVRVRKIIENLKDFARVDTDQQWCWADLHQGIDSTLSIIASEVKYKADVVREYGPLCEVECLPSQINQVIMNLVVNAAHSIGPERGVITIRTGQQGDDSVWIDIIDNGSGIDADVLPRIFDPFFTTKPVGKGTGLGLSLSYGIVQKHQGQLTVQSKPGIGTTFRITLPVRHEGALPV